MNIIYQCMFEEEGGKNSIEEFSQITNERSHGLGIKSILQRYKSNSQILKISNWFAQKTIPCDHLISNEIRFLGNASDLWSLLCFEIKAVGLLLSSNHMDIQLAKKQCEFGQFFMLYKAQSKIPNLKIKLEIETFYLQKITKLREQIMKERVQSLGKLNVYSESGQQVSLWLVSEYFSEGNEANIINKLKKFLKNIIFCINQTQKEEPGNVKTQQIINLICSSLLFVLTNGWEKVCFSQFFFTHCLIKHLIEPNGAMILGKFLHDARSNVLATEVEKFGVELSKQ